MADDDRPDERDPELAAHLAVEPLDEVTRRRLVATALAAGPHAAHTRTGISDGRRTHAWRWVAAAAAVVIVAVGGLAILTAEGGHDEQQASTPVRTQERAADATGSGSAAVASVGDFGDLDVATNLAALRDALVASPAKSSTAADAPPEAAQAAPTSRAPCAGDLPAGNVLAEGTGTLDGRAATVVLTRLADGSRSFDVLLADPCEVRHLR